MQEGRHRERTWKMASTELQKPGSMHPCRRLPFWGKKPSATPGIDASWPITGGQPHHTPPKASRFPPIHPLPLPFNCMCAPPLNIRRHSACCTAGRRTAGLPGSAAQPQIPVIQCAGNSGCICAAPFEFGRASSQATIAPGSEAMRVPRNWPAEAVELS